VGRGVGLGLIVGLGVGRSVGVGRLYLLAATICPLTTELVGLRVFCDIDNVGTVVVIGAGVYAALILIVIKSNNNTISVFFKFIISGSLDTYHIQPVLSVPFYLSVLIERGLYI